MKTCETCGAPVNTHPGRPGRFCSRACYNAAGRPRRAVTTKGARMRRAMGHPLAPPSGIVAECRIVLYEKIGPAEHHCHWCGRKLRWRPGDRVSADSTVADHLDWDNQNDSPDNLVPSCRVCNAHRTREGSRQLISDDELFIVDNLGRRIRAVERACENCGSDFLAAIAGLRRGRGRFCCRSCARSAGGRRV